MRTPTDLSGIRYGRLTAMEYAGSSQWKCKCDCGNETIVFATNLKQGRTTSCGHCYLIPRGRTRAEKSRLESANGPRLRGPGAAYLASRQLCPPSYVRIYWQPWRPLTGRTPQKLPYRAVCVWTDDEGRMLAASHPIHAKLLRYERGARHASIEEKFMVHLERAGHVPLRVNNQPLSTWIAASRITFSAEQVGEGTTTADAMDDLKARLKAQGVWTADRDEFDAKLAALPRRSPPPTEDPPMQESPMTAPTPARRPPPPPTRRPVVPPHPTGDDDPGSDDDIWALG